MRRLLIVPKSNVGISGSVSTLFQQNTISTQYVCRRVRQCSVWAGVPIAHMVSVNGVHLRVIGIPVVRDR